MQFSNILRATMASFGFVIFLAGCTSITEDNLVGTWRAIEVIEDGGPIDYDFSNVHLTFKKNGRYQFQGTLEYEEAGKYGLEAPKLYVFDTVGQIGAKKWMEIVELSSSDLVLKMKDDGKDRIMKLKKNKY